MLLYFLMIMAFCHVDGKNQYSAMIGTITAISKEIDSSCIILIHTPNQLRQDYNRILLTARAVATDLTIDVCVTIMTFQKFLDLYNSRRRYLDCKSPIMIIIHDDEESRHELENLSRSVPMQDVTWICYGNEDLDIWFKNVVITFSTIFLVGRQENASYVTINELYRVSNDHPLRTPIFGYWSDTNYSMPRSNVFNRRFNLEGMLLRTGSTQNAPIHSFEYNANGEKELVGYFPEVWKQLEEILNFTSIHYASVDNVTGIKEKNGNWNGLIGMLLADQIDVAVSEFIMDASRSHVIEFSRPLVKTSYQIFFKNVGDNYNWDAVVRPFDKYVWIAILTWIAVGSCVLALVFFISYSYGLEDQSNSDDFNLTNAMFFHLKSICSQGHNIIPRAVPCRILYLTAYVVTCVMVPSYSASLISYLTFRTPKRPFDNLHGFLEAKTHKLQTNSKTAEYTYFSEATDPTIQKIYKELFVKIPAEDLPLNTHDALDRICKDPHLAHFGDMAAAYSFLQYMKINKNCDIVILSQSLSTIYSGMALRRHSPYKMVINHFLQKMEDHGIVDRTWAATLPTNKMLKTAITSKVEVYDVAQTFLLLMLGACLAFTILLFERCYFCWSNRKKQQIEKLFYNKKHINFVLAKSELKLSFVR